MESYFQSNSVKNTLKCPKAKSATHCLTKLFPIYQNKNWTIRRWEDHPVDPSSHRIILKIVGFYVSYEQPLTKSVAEKNGIQLSFLASSNLYIDLVAPENDGGVHIEECRRKWGPGG